MAIEAIRIASYTNSPNFSQWLGGKDAFEAQTKQAVARLSTSTTMLQADPIFTGHATDRVVRAFPASVTLLQRYSIDPARDWDRLNYHACALSFSTAELLLTLEDPVATEPCRAAGIRGNTCFRRLSSVVRAHSTVSADLFDSACKGRILPDQY